MLRGTTAAAVGAAGLGAASGAGAASGSETASGSFLDDPSIIGGCGGGWEDAPPEFPVIDLTRSDPVTRGDFPVGADEIAIFVHGFLEVIAGGGEDQGYTFDVALERDADYDVDVAAAVWNSNTDWVRAKRNADRAGERLASWLADYLSRCPDTTIRLVGHSLGGRVSLRTLDALGGTDVLETVSILGAAVDPDTVCADGEYADGIERSAEEVYSYYSNNDDIVCDLYRVDEGTEALGCDGSYCEDAAGVPPENYEDVDVTGRVDGHCDYMKPGGVADEIAGEY